MSNYDYQTYCEMIKAERKLKRQMEDLGNSNKKARGTEDLGNSTLTDIVLVASSGLSIPANRFILACRSPVFRAMFESESGIIKIGEVSYDTLGVFVSYMYTGEAILDEKMACDLLKLGDKYQIPHLKASCETFLNSNLCIGSPTQFSELEGCILGTDDEGYSEIIQETRLYYIFE